MPRNGNFYFFTGKKLIFERFFDFLRSAFGHGRLGHLQSLEYYNNSDPILNISNDMSESGGDRVASSCCINVFISFQKFLSLLKNSAKYFLNQGST